MLKMTTDLPFIKKITQNPKFFSREKKSPSYLKPYLNLNQPPSFNFASILLTVACLTHAKRDIKIARMEKEEESVQGRGVGARSIVGVRSILILS